VTIHDCWNTIVALKNLKLDGTSIYYVEAHEIKTYCNQAEPRKVAKIDSRAELPTSLSNDGNPYFVMPVKFSRYALVPGDGYHDLEYPQLSAEDFEPTHTVPHTVALGNGESAAVWTALYSGLLSKITNSSTLASTLHNERHRLHLPAIRYREAWQIEVDGAQLEVDAGFEGEAAVYLFECKAWSQKQLLSFNVRQLFFPYWYVRNQLTSLGVEIPIHLFFLNLEPSTRVYRWWEYKFDDEDPTDYSSLTRVRQGAYRISRRPPVLAVERLMGLITEPASRTRYVPQANDVAKVQAVVKKVGDGVDSVRALTAWFDFDSRQTHYYTEAAEELGFLKRTRARPYEQTELGVKLASIPPDQAAALLLSRALTLPIFRNIIDKLSDPRFGPVSQSIIARWIPEVSEGRYNGETARRRAECVVQWCRWIGETTGALSVTESNSIHLPMSMVGD
jgi:hypothetical protein